MIKELKNMEFYDETVKKNFFRDIKVLDIASSLRKKRNELAWKKINSKL
jgi:hypothetical protein